MSERQYPIRYKVEFGEHASKELKEQGYAAADEILIGSVVRFPDGKGSIAWHACAGRPDQPMSAGKVFSAWLALATKLATDENLNNLQREILLNALNAAKNKTERL